MQKIAPAWKWVFLLLLALIAVLLAFHFDGTLRQWVVEHSNRTARQVMRNVSHYGDWPEHIGAGLLVVAVAWWRGNKRWVRIGLAMILACAMAGIVARGLKITTGRARPSVKEELGWNGPSLSPKHNSFPSGHTAATTAFFGVLLFVNRRVGLALLPVPLFIAASRMYVAAHFLSDVICAAIIGILCAWLCARACLVPE
ncbi:MAG TPA: phosphatase PAP2 family protein [Chthoniobacterales bacterium]|jgi:undecaprenyl-diphosphatase|nr:phosphatase PAP2 family protein [Chthoniobacterales bacterium]